MIRYQESGIRHQGRCRGFAAPFYQPARSADNNLIPDFCPLIPERGFTLLEMIVVIVITGILGGIVAIFIKAPVQGYVDSARRAEMTDIADTALRRITRDVRLALPNSVRVTSSGANFYLEFIPTTGGGRYRAGAPGDELNFASGTDATFAVLGPSGVAATATDFVAIYNLGIPSASGVCTALGADAYEGCNRRPAVSGGTTITFTPDGVLPFPFASPGNRFHIVTTPVTYVCAPAAGGGGTLTRYWGYAMQPLQPSSVAAAPLSTAPASAPLATNVGAVAGGGCSFAYQANVGAQRTGLVTLQLAITKSGESVSLYNASHVSNEP